MSPQEQSQSYFSRMAAVLQDEAVAKVVSEMVPDAHHHRLSNRIPILSLSQRPAAALAFS